MKFGALDITTRQGGSFLIGAGFALLFSVIGVFNAIGGVPDDLQRRGEAALSIYGANGVAVEMDGQTAHLHGVLANEEKIAEAVRAVLHSAGPGGAWAGGVTGVNVSDLSVGPMHDPFQWRVSRRGKSVRLSGDIPSGYARAALLRAASVQFPNADPAVDDMALAGGAPTPDWLTYAGDAMVQLAKVGNGEARLIGTQIILIADDASAEAAEDVRAHYARFEDASAPYRARVDVGVTGANSATRGLADGGADACAQRFAQLMDDNVINFAPGSAQIDPSSQGLLDTLASVALRCDRFSIQVSGHTDNQGARALNMDLSQRRAEAVVNYLERQGVSPARMSAKGYGPDQPRASNATQAGQASNRRIEFTVSG